MTEHVIAGVDGSEGGRAAAVWAAGEAAARGTALRLLHAEPPEPQARPPLRGVGEWRRGAERMVRHTAEAAARHGTGASVSGARVTGDAAEVLSGAGASAELLVLGTRGLGGFEGLAVGSVALEAAGRAPCPVVLVPPSPAADGGATGRAATEKGAAGREAAYRAAADREAPGPYATDPCATDPDASARDLDGGDLDGGDHNGGDLDGGELAGPYAAGRDRAGREVGRHDAVPGAAVHGPGPEVVVGVDARRPDAGALRFAFEAALRHGARLRAVHAWCLPAPYTVPWTPYDVLEEERGGWEDHEVQLLDDALRPWRKTFPDADVLPDVRLFSPAEALVRVSPGAVLLVVGRGGGPAPRLGAVTHAVAHHARCPVAVVPDA
ncbi:universal stress protein [Streptomyces sp. Ru87]|uniref:universal stress protein n=2 Tax=unclassified Streptomyces TaxID=2593676 RepID=UPI000BF8D177|nr:universal stress protein [Streptomyces sp. Ru87]PGH51595.1 hypothetical protein CRI70_05665 [Streptomyces sp. Ru87]